MKHESCEGCRHNLGGGRENCRINAEYECRDGGGFELWEVKNDEAESIDRAPQRTLEPHVPAVSNVEGSNSCR